MTKPISKPELTGEQIEELQKAHRYVRFVPDGDGYALEAAGKVERKKKTLWKRINVPEAKGKSRSTIQLYALQVVDLQAY